jgi:hypothetical protein
MPFGFPPEQAFNFAGIPRIPALRPENFAIGSPLGAIFRGGALLHYPTFTALSGLRSNLAL